MPALHFCDLGSFGIVADTYLAHFLAENLENMRILEIDFDDTECIPAIHLHHSECSGQSADHF